MLPAIGYMLYMGVMMAAFVVTAVILIQRFYKNLLGSEGYLMFTLPVTVTQHLLSKTIIAVVMIALERSSSAFLSIGIFADRMILSMHPVCQTLSIKARCWRGAVRRCCSGWSCSCWRCSALRTWRCFVYMCMALGHLAGKSPPADVGRVVRCSFYRSAGSPASGDDGRGQCHAGGACRC